MLIRLLGIEQRKPRGIAIFFLALGEIAARISAAERRAMKAERETNDRLIAHFDEPFADSSAVPTFLVSRKASRSTMNASSARSSEGTT